MTHYIWKNHKWHQFYWNEKIIAPMISSARIKQGGLFTKINSLNKNETIKAQAESLIQETRKTAQIEGQNYSSQSVRSSVHKQLGLSYAGLPKSQRQIDGLVQILLDTNKDLDEKLTLKRIKSWQAAMFPKEIIGEMKRFTLWWNQSQSREEGLIRAGIAHFYFLTIHPFDDGNGRIARALADLALAQDDKQKFRYYSMSSQIFKNRKKYYQILEQIQKSNTQDITKWLKWFIECFEKSLDDSNRLLAKTFFKLDFWKKNAQKIININQKKVLNKIMDNETNAQRIINTKKYAAIAKVSRATAYRDLNDLLKKKIIRKNKLGGRSTSYYIDL